MTQADKQSHKVALCLSGGGVRSAAFSIGVLEALDGARSKNGRDFDYLSTVSGGGFAGSWYVARKDVAVDRGKLWKDGKPNKEERALRHNMYARLGGYLDSDKQKLRGPTEILLAYLGRLLLFWLFLVPFLWTMLLVLAAVGLGVMHLLAAVEWGYAGPVVFIVLMLALWLRLGRLWLVMSTGLLTGAIASAYSIFMLQEFMRQENVANIGALLSGALVAAAALSGLLARSSTVTKIRWLTRVLGAARLIRIGAWVGIGLLLVPITWLLVASLPLFSRYFNLFPRFTLGWVDDARPLLLAGPLAIACLLGLMPSRWVSMADFYRDRIKDAFIGKGDTPRKLVHLVNTANNKHSANTAKDRAATQRYWDERKASSHPLLFDFREPDPAQCANDYWDAIATSAAVAGPRMGSYTARPIGLLLLLLNIRLGRTYENDKVSKEPLIAAVWRALLGLDAPKSKMELSDGGHFDNLGLYEAVSRRCTRILVVDGGCDPDYQFSDLANAVRKIRNDFGVDVELDGLRWSEDGEVLPSPTGKQRQRVYGGSVRYPNPDEIGQIVYIKAALVGDEPADVAGYADLHPRFPHESTSDQWFSESQFESYRRLGEYTVKKALNDYRDAKTVWADKREQKDLGAVDLVENLREAGITVGRPDLRPNLAGVILWTTSARRPAEREFLMVQSSGGGSWVLPKGHIERGESADECARRELFEEAGFKLKRDPNHAPVVIADRFERRGKTEHCLYWVRELKDSKTSRIGREERRVIWITANDYEQAWRARTDAPNPEGKAAPVRQASSNGDVHRLSQAREFYGDLLWLLDEANRKLSKTSTG